jgi:hypothetical protein
MRRMAMRWVNARSSRPAVRRTDENNDDASILIVGSNERLSVQIAAFA